MAIGVYCDVHIARAISFGLRERGVEVVRAQDDGTTRLKDPALLDRATELGFILYTHDDDLLVEANSRSMVGKRFSGVVFSHALHSPIGRCIDDLEIIAKSLEADQLVSVIEYIPF